MNIAENISSSHGNDYDIVDIKTHEDYSTKTKQNDIALLKLIKRIPERNENIYPACLYNKANDPSPLTATGWGYTQPGKKLNTFFQLKTIVILSCRSKTQFNTIKRHTQSSFSTTLQYDLYAKNKKTSHKETDMRQFR